MDKLIDIIPGLLLLVLSSPGSASRTRVESLHKPRDSTSVLKALPGKLDIKRHSPSILYVFVFDLVSFPLGTISWSMIVTMSYLSHTSRI